MATHETTEMDARGQRTSRPVTSSAGLLAEEISALRKLAQDRRRASFILFCNSRRPLQGFGPETPGKKDLGRHGSDDCKK
jgi:hypothetical protein